MIKPFCGSGPSLRSLSDDNYFPPSPPPSTFFFPCTLACAPGGSRNMHALAVANMQERSQGASRSPKTALNEPLARGKRPSLILLRPALSIGQQLPFLRAKSYLFSLLHISGIWMQCCQHQKRFHSRMFSNLSPFHNILLASTCHSLPSSSLPSFTLF